jgi:hypothetical protein
MARALGRPTEELLAGVTLARACRASGDEAAARGIARELAAEGFAGASAHARRELEALLREGPRPVSARAGAPSRPEGRP